MQTSAPLEVLRECSFCRELAPETLAVVADRVIHRSVPTGYVLFRKGEKCRGCYFLVAGEVEIYRATHDGREQILHTDRAPAVVAELPMFDEGEYPASARARQRCELYFLSLDDFARLYREHPEIADAVIRSLGRKLRELVELVEKISLKSVPGRVAATLLELAAEAGARCDRGQFVLPRTQEELAGQLGTTRESVARALGDFRRRGWICQEGGRITLLSVADLERASADRCEEAR